MTAFLINLNVCGMGQTGKKGLCGWELSKGGPSPCEGPGLCILSGVQPKGDQNRPRGLAETHRVDHWMTLEAGLERREG